jgi:hypothetical protein
LRCSARAEWAKYIARMTPGLTATSRSKSFQHFASDAERLARFKREAQILAALTHPNIGAIFGLETPR